ncbi:MAG TPA: serine/threonine-protein kinase [Nocardioidaceae bacterium]|nr:serine/threonine-protein kinase [Nocardioidaceae bacterium]
MGRVLDSWNFAQGDAITDDLTAMRLLGGGEAYEAYLAFDDLTYAPVVVKVVRPGQVTDGSTLRGLRREVDTLSSVNHPAVVRGLRAVLDGERPHVVLEQLDGPRLSTLVRRYGPLPEQQYLPLAIEIASALHYLRRQRLVHLDVKPSNIIMGAPARLIDLSVARTLEDAERLGHPIGTDAYMAPEQCDPPATGTPGFASDVWGLGATLFEAIAGYRPFDAGAADDDDAAARFPQLRELSYTLPAQIPADVAKIVYACLEPEPADRPLPHEVADGLGPALERAPRGRLAGFKVR